MKLIIAIVSDTDADHLIEQLVQRGYPATKIGSSGGFLRRGNATILSGVEEEEVEDVLATIRRQCRSRTEHMPRHTLPFPSEALFLPEQFEVRVGGAIVFVVPVDRFEKT